MKIIVFICIFITFSECQEKKERIGFAKLGSYGKSLVKDFNIIIKILFFKQETTNGYFPQTKTYWYSTHFWGQWYQAKLICHDYGLELVSFESEKEVDAFFQLCENSNLINDWFYVDGITEVERSLTEWYQADTGKKINFPIKFSSGEPNSGDGGKIEKCLSIVTRDDYGFNDVSCAENQYNWKFVCQSRLLNAPGK